MTHFDWLWLVEQKTGPFTIKRTRHRFGFRFIFSPLESKEWSSSYSYMKRLEMDNLFRVCFWCCINSNNYLNFYSNCMLSVTMTWKFFMHAYCLNGKSFCRETSCKSDVLHKASLQLRLCESPSYHIMLWPCQCPLFWFLPIH